MEGTPPTRIGRAPCRHRSIYIYIYICTIYVYRYTYIYIYNIYIRMYTPPRLEACSILLFRDKITRRVALAD